MINKTCCFTGHRAIPRDKYFTVTEELEDIVTSLIHRGYRYFGAGGALGFDTLAAQTILKLKNIYPEIRLILVLPCKNQTKNWQKEDIEIYEDIKARCDKYVYISDEYTNDCMLKRNRLLVDNSSYCICYLNKKTGGTAYTVNYAKKKGVGIYNLAHGK